MTMKHTLEHAGSLVRVYIGVYDEEHMAEMLYGDRIHPPDDAAYAARLYWTSGPRTFKPENQHMIEGTLDELLTSILKVSSGHIPRILAREPDARRAKFLDKAGYVPLDPDRRKWARNRMLQLYRHNSDRKRYKAPLHRLTK